MRIAYCQTRIMDIKYGVINILLLGLTMKPSIDNEKQQAKKRLVSKVNSDIKLTDTEQIIITEIKNLIYLNNRQVLRFI